MSTLSRVRRLWLTSLNRWLPYKAISLTEDEAPPRLAARRVYAVGNPAWRVVFSCPCGCSDPVDLCLLPNFRPHWRLQIDQARKVTLHPSVWRNTGCRSHYMLKSGRIRWV